MLLWLLACGPAYEEGQVEVGKLNCARMEACGTMIAGMDLASCQEVAAAQGYSEDQCPDYDPAQMRKCIEAYTTAVAEVDCDSDLNALCQVCGG